MRSAASVIIHPSQFPEAVRRDLLASLRRRQVNHKFHYDSIKQTQKWLTLHQRYSPSRRDADCRRTYEHSFAAAAETITSRQVHVVGLGCGGGQKDTRLLALLKRRGCGIFYTPCDVSTAMVLVARQAALAVLPAENCFPTVCDLVTGQDLDAVLGGKRGTTRLFTFFGMIPNFEPEDILPKLAALLGPGDWLLFSANLAPGDDYADGMEKILPQYNNLQTSDWLMTFLTDVGVEKGDGKLKFSVESVRNGLKRVVVNFHFRRSRKIAVEDKTFSFRAGDVIRLFFSYRYTPARIAARLKKHGLHITGEWITRSGEEGVFLCRRRG